MLNLMSSFHFDTQGHDRQTWKVEVNWGEGVDTQEKQEWGRQTQSENRDGEEIGSLEMEKKTSL